MRTFVALGPLPDSSADEAVIRAHEEALAAMGGRVNDDEARALLVCFGPDECFGLAWTLLHLVETASVHPLIAKPDDDSNPWLQLLWQRAH
ncbi:MAG: hypothetical protein F9K40_00820 [Kofleriaceae bacterium]|nr:MAG: hypothetical protein F9K40_00820 [Kofleriaceae bacterium]MBZ0236268.1 hypothetical protein [Kofleriaceae bacterium]